MRATIGTELLRHLPRRPTDIRDTKLVGFVLRVRPTGYHSYLISLGRGKWYTIGSIEVLKPDEARQQARAMLVDRDKGKDPLAERREARRAGLTLSAFLKDHYEPWVLTHRKSGPKTLARLRGAFGEFGARSMGALTPWLIEKWRTARLKTGVEQATVNRDVTALKAALNRAVTWKLIPPHALQDVKPFLEDKIGRLRYLSDAEEKRLRKALATRDERRGVDRRRANAWRRGRGYREWPAYGTYTDTLTPIVLLALNTGLRFGELTGLEWRDIDVARALLTVRTIEGKSGRTRHVPLNVQAVRVLKAWRPRENAPSDYVFPGRDGARLQDIKTAWMPLLKPKAANIIGFRFHDLRHTFASRLVMAGVDLNTVRELLGHSDIKMTLRYAHLAPEHKAAAVAKLVRA